MALGFTKPRFSPIAIDFGTDTLKVLQLSLGDAPQLIASASAVIPESARSDLNSRRAFLSGTLKNLLKSQPFKGRRAIVSIPAFQTLIQHIELTKAEHEDFDAQIGLHLIQRFNVDPSRMVVRNHSVGKIVRDGATRYQVVCVAARRDAVMKYIDLATQCKLEVVGMHSEPMALVRAHPLLQNGQKLGEGVPCYIDIGAGMTKLIVPHGEELAFAKTVHASGDHLTRELAQMRGIKFDQARNLRVQPSMQHTAAVDEEGPGLGTVVSESKETGAVEGGEVSMTVESLIDELRLSIRYYHSVFPERPIQQLVFLGGESQDVKMCQLIARSVRIAARLGDPFAGVDTLDYQGRSGGIESYKPMPGWAVPLGLCFSEANL